MKGGWNQTGTAGRWPGAVVDVWSCDGNGVYDNTDFRLRGHQFTDAEGRFAFETVKPRDYRDFRRTSM